MMIEIFVALMLISAAIMFSSGHGLLGTFMVMAIWIIMFIDRGGILNG